MTRCACIVIASEKRRAKVRDHVLPSITTQVPAFDEVVVVGDWPDDGEYTISHGNATLHSIPCIRYLCVEPLLRTTTDALCKRDAGTVATTSDTLVYVCDDHALDPHFTRDLHAVLGESWDVLVPNRYTYVDTQRIPLNNGEHARYCGGHAGVFRRALIRALPWSAGPHDRTWDVTMSRAQQALGANFRYYPRLGIAVQDLEPEAQPWR